MDIKQITEWKKNGLYKRISDWADSEGIENINEREKLFFTAEAYEKTGELEKSIRAYEKGLREHQDDLVPERLFSIYRQLNDENGLRAMKEYLEEESLADDIIMLSEFELLRIGRASTDELIKVLTAYVEEYNDELYFLLLLELLIEKKDVEKANRYLNKFIRLFVSKKYEKYVQGISKTITDKSMELPKDSIRKVIYARTVQETESKNTIQPKKSAPIKKQELPKKTRIKTKALIDAVSNMLSEAKQAVHNLTTPPSIDDRFQNIVGMKEIQNKLGFVYYSLRSQQLRQNNDFEATLLDTTHFTITGGHGTGKTMLAETLGQLLMDFGVRGQEEAVTVEAKEFEVNLQNLDALKDVTLIVENLDRVMEAGGGTYGEFCWKLRNYLKEHKEEVSVILTGSKEAVNKLFEEERELRPMIYETLDIEPYSNKELGQIFELVAKEQQWLLTEDALELVKKQLAKEKLMSTFECANSMKEKLKEAAKRAAIRMADMEDDPTEEQMVTLEESDFITSGVQASVPELLEQLDKMTGLTSVKEQVNSIVSKLLTAKQAEKMGAAREMAAQSLHMVFKGAPGTGKTTIARIIANIYIALGVLPGNDEGLVEVSAGDLVGQYVGESKQKTKAVVNRAMGGVLFIDEAYTLTNTGSQFGKEAAEELLTVLENNRDSIMVIFAGYTKEMDEFLSTNPGFSSRIPTQIIFDDYTVDEMISIFYSIMEKQKLMLDRGTADAIKELIETESKVLDFGNARGVRNLTDLVKSAMDERLAGMLLDGKQPSTNDYDIIRLADIEAVLNHATDGSKTLEELLEDLNSLEGMATLKGVINKNVNAAKASKAMKEKGIESTVEFDNLHMVFTGAPGTGKTTTARKIGYIYKALGILPRGDVINECSRPELVAEFSGQTAPKVKEMIGRSMGGVLFIDEAYTLSRDKGDTFGREAIDTLVKDMEDQRGKFMIILAGYTKEMEEFLDANPGLRSRVAHTIEFEDYSLEQMESIFYSMAKKSGYTVEEEAKTLVRKLLEERSRVKDFGNARGVRNTLNAVISEIYVRIAEVGENITDDECHLIKKEDVQKLLPKKETKGEKSVEDLLIELNTMIGLGSVKEKVNEIVAQAKFNKIAAERGLGSIGDNGSLHLLFKGNAGTGKTTVARMLGEIYAKIGVLQSGHVVECNRDSLVAGYVGQTAIKTQEVINKAMGGILFVDEAYTLNSNGTGSDFGQEALTTIMTAMENNRDNLMVIFAGYSKEIDQLIATNQGLESRFSKQNEIIFEAAGCGLPFPMPFFTLPVRPFSQSFFFRLCRFSWELAKVSLFSLPKVFH